MGKRNNRGALPAFRERKRSNGKTYYYYDAGAMEYSLKFDSQTQKALQLLSSDNDYNAILKK